MNTESTETTNPPASEETKALNAAIDAEPDANSESEALEQKKERTSEQKSMRAMQRKIDRLLHQRGELRAKLAANQDLTREPEGGDNRVTPSDNETLSLSRKELQALVDKEAKKLAQSIRQQESEIEPRRAVVDKLAKDLGKEKFDALTSALDEALDGLTDENKRPKPVVDALLEADDPKGLLEYLADPDNADEAEAIGRMSAMQAARAITKLESKLAAERAKDKPQPSNAPKPIEPIQGAGGGTGTRRLGDLTDAEFDKRRRQQIAARR